MNVLRTTSNHDEGTRERHPPISSPVSPRPKCIHYADNEAEWDGTGVRAPDLPTLRKWFGHISIDLVAEFGACRPGSHRHMGGGQVCMGRPNYKLVQTTEVAKGEGLGPPTL